MTTRSLLVPIRSARRRPFSKDERAVTEIVGSLLLIGITVILIAGLAILILNVRPPADPLSVDVDVLTTRGADGAWGTGDEQVRVHHVGGEAIPRDGFSIQIEVDGAVSTFAGGGLTGAFDDGTLTIGETWNVTLTIPSDANVHVQMVENKGGASTLIQSAQVRSGGSCLNDLIPPTVVQWTQTPPNVDGLTTGSVTVVAELADACGSVDETVHPHLIYRLNPGTDPPYTDTGAMTKTGTNTWTGTIPAQTWATLYGQSLQYQLTGMTDTSGNSGSSLVRTDPIQFVGTQTYVQSFIATQGTVNNFANAQTDADSGAVATMVESTTTVATERYATGSSASGGVGAHANVRGAPDNTYYGLDGHSDYVRATAINTGTSSGSISKVEMVYEGHYTGSRIDDVVDLRVDAGSGFVTVVNDYVPTLGGIGIDSQRIVDITGIRGSWTWTNVQNLILEATYEKISGPDSMVVQVDSMFVRVTAAGGNTDLVVQMDFPVLPASPSNILELRYATAQETFHIEVWDGTTWNQRGTALSSGPLTTWVYSLTPLETSANGGAPRIRAVDDSLASPQGTLSLDYVRVVST